MGVASKTRGQEKAAALLGDSEILSVQHPEASHIPALGKRADDRLNVLAISGMEQCRDVFKHQPSGLKLLDNFHDLKEESAAAARKTSVLLIVAHCSHVADVLAGESKSDAGHGGQGI